MNLLVLQKIQSILQNTPQSARLVAVTKSFDLAQTKSLIEAGVKAIAQNRVERAMEKFPNLPGAIEKHFIGRVQSKKIPKLVQWFDVIESIGSIECLFKIDYEAQKQNKKIRVLLQFNISGEPQKDGFDVDECENIEQELPQIHHVQVIGLMGMATDTEDQGLIRSQFQKLRQLRDQFQKKFPIVCELSMGMSTDFMIALEEGATMVRIGSLFAEKNV